MKLALSVAVMVFAFIGIQAKADWQCIYACGSRGQEQKIGRGYDQYEARRNAYYQRCTRYSGGYPQYDLGCTWINEPGHGGGGGYPGYEEWQCTFSCGSRGQEPKVGRGRNPREASWDAQRQYCARYEGGHPKYPQGCSRVH